MFFKQDPGKEITAKKIKELPPTIQYFIVRINNPDHPNLKYYYSEAFSSVYKISGETPVNPADRYFQEKHSTSCNISHSNRQSLLHSYEKEAIEYVQNMYKEYIKIIKPAQIAPPVAPKNKWCFWNKDTCQVVGVAATGIVAITALYSMLNRS